MIGVVSKPDQIPVVEEFFELFKTPWEFHTKDRRYDTVIVTADEVPDIEARLLLIFGPDPKEWDAQHGIVAHAHRRLDACLTYRSAKVPVFGPLVTFASAGATVVSLAGDPDAAGIQVGSTERRVVRLGYDLFDEVQFLLTTGQPVEHANTPTLDLHIAMLREWILNAGIPLLEIPPVPAGHSFAICLTHDIDFVGIRRHRFDHTMWGFLYRSTIGAVRGVIRRRISLARLLQMWRAAAVLPFVFLGWARDFWDPFDWYLRVEKNLPATYYLIPFKGRQGDYVPGRHASRRATAYDVADLTEWSAKLLGAGCELGVHGIDAWHNADKGRAELARISAVTGRPDVGIRMHWLLQGAGTALALEQAGYVYDSTVGYNETIGYRSGTTQVFRPLGVQRLLEMPMHVQDGALFFPNRLDLPESDAWQRCEELLRNAGQLGGVLTVIWHDRSHGPERFWGNFYIKLVAALRSSDGWFGTAMQVVGWFRKRRAVRFEVVDGPDGARICVSGDGEEIQPPLRIRLHRHAGMPSPATSSAQTEATFADIHWNGTASLQVDAAMEAAGLAAARPKTELCLS